MKNVINYFILFIILSIGVFVSLEISLRTFLTIKHFSNPHANYWGKTWYRLESLKYSKFDEYLISDLSEAAYKNVDLPRWKKKSNITVNEKGFRDNKNNILDFKNNKKILVTGDSFTFGYQVSDNETWPSCLEKKTKLRVHNGGHGGYSTGQSLRKAIIESNREKYDYFIWSIFFDDFNRDKSNKIIIKKNNQLHFNKFQKLKKIKSETQKKLFYHYLKEYFFVVYILDRELFKKTEIRKQIEYKPIIGEITNYKKEEQIEFLLNEFSKIEIKQKYILLQYADQSKNIKKLDKIRNQKIVNNYKQILLKNSKKKNIKILDTIEFFDKMSEDEKRQLWFDHHTAEGNLKVCEFILSKLDFN